MKIKDVIKQKEIVDAYVNGSSAPSIAKSASVSNTAIFNILKKYNVELRSPKDRNRKEINDHFFDNVNSEEKAYWLGFLLADGCMSDNGSLSVAVAEKDKSHIELFKQTINSKHKLNQGSDSSGFINYKLTFRSHYLSKSLQLLGITPRKSLNALFPKLFDEVMLRHIIMGYFDGDGCVAKHGNSLRVSFVGSYECLDKIASSFNSIGVSNKSVMPHGKIFRIEWNSKDDILKIHDYLYSESIVYLDRKKISSMKIFAN